MYLAPQILQSFLKKDRFSKLQDMYSRLLMKRSSISVFTVGYFEKKENMKPLPKEDEYVFFYRMSLVKKNRFEKYDFLYPLLWKSSL